MIIIETGFPRERANCNNRTALRLRRSDGLRPRRRGAEPQTTQFSKSVPSTSHVGVGSETRFHIRQSHARMTGRYPRAKSKFEVANKKPGRRFCRQKEGGREEGIISDLLLSQTQPHLNSQPSPSSLYAAAAVGQKSASLARNLGDQSGLEER